MIGDDLGVVGVVEAGPALPAAGVLLLREGDRHPDCFHLNGDRAPMDAVDTKIVYWHRDLPPLEAVALGEHTVEATSDHVPGLVAHDELWSQCYDSLMAQAHVRLAQEVSRLGGHYAHVLDESIDARHNDAIGEAWLHGRFTYMLYRQPTASAKPQA
jgi:hypothetical protein